MRQAVEEGLPLVPLQKGGFLLEEEDFNSNGVASLGRNDIAGQFDGVLCDWYAGEGRLKEGEDSMFLMRYSNLAFSYCSW